MSCRTLLLVNWRPSRTVRLSLAKVSLTLLVVVASEGKRIVLHMLTSWRPATVRSFFSGVDTFSLAVRSTRYLSVPMQMPFSIESKTQSDVTQGIFHFLAYLYLSPSGFRRTSSIVVSMSRDPVYVPPWASMLFLSKSRSFLFNCDTVMFKPMSAGHLYRENWGSVAWTFSCRPFSQT